MTSGLLKNIELLISLIENAKMNDWDDKTRRLKELVQADIENILTPYKRGRFYFTERSSSFTNAGQRRK